MQNKQQKPLYPTPTRGPLRTDSSLPTAPTRRRRLMHDYEPATLLAFLAGGVVLFGVLGIAVFYLAFHRSQRDASKDIAVAVAQRIAEHNSAESYETMQTHIDREFKNCTGLPQITITHYYTQPAHTETTVVDPNEPDITSMLERVVDRSDGAEHNRLSVSCPI